MSNISSLVVAISAEIASATGYTELPHAITVGANARVQRENRYELVVLDSVEVSGVNLAVTLDTSFQIILADNFVAHQSNDTEKRAVSIALYDKMLDSYKKIVQQKGGAPSIVMHVKNLSISSPEFTEENDMAVIRGNFTVTHRVAL